MIVATAPPVAEGPGEHGHPLILGVHVRQDAVAVLKAKTEGEGLVPGEITLDEGDFGPVSHGRHGPPLGIGRSDHHMLGHRVGNVPGAQAIPAVVRAVTTAAMAGSFQLPRMTFLVGFMVLKTDDPRPLARSLAQDPGVKGDRRRDGSPYG